MWAEGENNSFLFTVIQFLCQKLINLGSREQIPHQEEHHADSDVGEHDAHPDLVGQRVEEGEHTRFGLGGFLDHDGDSQRHEGFGEVDHLLSHQSDGQRGDGHVGLLQEDGEKRPWRSPIKHGFCLPKPTDGFTDSVKTSVQLSLLLCAASSHKPASFRALDPLSNKQTFWWSWNILNMLCSRCSPQFAPAFSFFSGRNFYTMLHI